MPQTAAMTAAMTAAQQTPQEAPDAEDAKRRFREAAVEWDHETSRRRRVLYADVEALVNTGFLSHQVKIGPLHLALRSLVPGDTFMLTHRVGLGANDRQWKTWLVATSVWMVNGVCLLEDSEAPVRMYRIIEGLPTGVVDTLATLVLGLYNRTSTALLRTEAYCYEPYSRVAWRMCGRMLPTAAGVGGIPGVTRLGMNHTQRMWVAYNLSEDDREQMLRDWSAAKLVASASSPKGVRKLNAADERLKQQEERRRKDIIEKMVHTILYGEEAEAEQEIWRVRVDGEIVEVPAVKVARTEEELQEDFRKWVAGEKDWHDIIVDTYKARIRAKYDNERQAREEALADVEYEAGVTGETGMVAYTLEQLQELRPDLAANRPAARRVFDTGAPVAVYQKWVGNDVSPGRLRADEHGVYEAPIDRPEAPSLQERVLQRRPVLSDGPTEPIAHPGVEDGD